MYKIIINTSQDGTILVKNCSQYSILKSSIIELHSGENILDDLKYGFYLEYRLLHSNDVILINLRDYDTSNIIDMHSMFMTCNITELDLSNFDISKLWRISDMFYYCSSLEWLDISSFTNMNCIVEYDCLFCGCHSLKHIRCTKSFKEWCIEHQNDICLPISM